MSTLIALACALTVAAGVYLALSRDLFRMVLGFAVLGSGVNLIVFAAGRFGPLAPPIIASDQASLLADAANPLPQALVLTAIVIGFALTCFSLVLAARLAQQTGSEDSQQLRAAEPVDPPGDRPGPLQ